MQHAKIQTWKFTEEKIITVKSNQRDQFFVLCSDGLLQAVDAQEAEDIVNFRSLTHEIWDLRGMKN